MCLGADARVDSEFGVMVTVAVTDPRGRLVIVSGPSGAGKSTVVKQLMQTCPLPLQFSVSATTRSPRAGEIDGREYHFLTEKEFQQRRQEGKFLECKQVFGLGHWYGTQKSTVLEGLQSGRWVLLEIDVEGAQELINGPLDPITVFIEPGGIAELEQRLRSRGTESESQITARLQTAATEYQSLTRYQHHVINDRIERAVAEICTILQNYQET